MLKSVRFFFWVSLLVSISFTAEATHLRAGNITVKRLSCTSYTYRITLHVYTRANSTVKFSSNGVGELNFGDGTPINHPGEQDNPPIIGESDNGPIGEVTYEVDHTYPGPGLYTITYYEQNRNEGILNINDSVGTPFFIQTQILIDDFIGGCNNTPQLLVPPVDQGCTGVKWTHNPGAYDPDGDSLSFEMYVPKQGGVYNSEGEFVSGIDVGGYANPNAQKFYSSVGIPYSNANENGNGSPDFKIDPVSGTVTWDAPGAPGEYNIAFIIREWRKVRGTNTWVNLGYVERDMQIVILDCKNDRPKLQVPPDLCVTAGTLIKQDIFATDPAVASPRVPKQDGDSTKIEAYSDIFHSVALPLATYTPGPAVWQPTTSNTQQAHIQFNWQTSCGHVKEQSWEVVFKATDNGAPPLASFETWKIRVVAPAPVWNSASLNPGQRSALLNWQPYTCNNAQFIQVWRKVDSTPFTPSMCVTGMPDYLGYELIATVAGNKTSYTDSHLEVGAKYCYRLVATFAQPDGGESYVSQEICLPPIIADAPVITNVTIDVTDQTAGKVTVKWRPPFEVDKTQFPPPYKYVVKRAEGFGGSVNIKQINSGFLSDTTYVDTDINTAQSVYNYRVFCYDANGGFVDTSAVASTVRLELKPLSTQIQLSWAASVPWSNTSLSYPMHLIYRGTNTNSKTISDLVLIDSVNISQHQLIYLDSGQWNKTPLVKSQDYCYAVMTKGSYGNSKIAAPLKNFSEITCINLNASQPPCKPVVTIKTSVKGCGSCQNKATGRVSNLIKWKRILDENCPEVKSYNIYAANGMDETFTLVANVPDSGVDSLSYEHTNLPSFAQCYKIAAVNRAGVEGELSDQFCFDNCTSYELPNVFTPNDDGCNDTFQPYNINVRGDPETGFVSICSYTRYDSINCARFVKSVSFAVYNRWGKQVYTYQGNFDDNDNSDVSLKIRPGIFIDWNGRDNENRELDPATYYFVANVVFDTVDPKKRYKTIKGWVQIVR